MHKDMIFEDPENLGRYVQEDMEQSKNKEAEKYGDWLKSSEHFQSSEYMTPTAQSFVSSGRLRTPAFAQKTQSFSTHPEANLNMYRDEIDWSRPRPVGHFLNSGSASVRTEQMGFNFGLERDMGRGGYYNGNGLDVNSDTALPLNSFSKNVLWDANKSKFVNTVTRESDPVHATIFEEGVLLYLSRSCGPVLKKKLLRISFQYKKIQVQDNSVFSDEQSMK